MYWSKVACSCFFSCSPLDYFHLHAWNSASGLLYCRCGGTVKCIIAMKLEVVITMHILPWTVLQELPHRLLWCSLFCLTRSIWWFDLLLNWDYCEFTSFFSVYVAGSWRNLCIQCVQNFESAKSHALKTSVCQWYVVLNVSPTGHSQVVQFIYMKNVSQGGPDFRVALKLQWGAWSTLYESHRSPI